MPKDRPFQALEFTINIKGKPARALADTGTIGGALISNKFVTTHNIPYTARKNPVTLKRAVKGSRSTCNFADSARQNESPQGAYASHASIRL